VVGINAGNFYHKMMSIVNPTMWMSRVRVTQNILNGQWWYAYLIADIIISYGFAEPLGVI
jgi:hypothetical protein